MLKVIAAILCIFYFPQIYSSSAISTESSSSDVVIHHNIPLNHRGIRIALVTFISEPEHAHRSESYNPYPDTVKWGTRSKVLYCQKHGYDFIIGSKKRYECDGIPAPNPDKLSIHWMKVPMLAQFLADYDWLIWTDADSIFLNPHITLESFLDDNYDVLLGSQNRIDPARNTGHIFMKNTPWCRHFLHEWWSRSEEVQEGCWDLENLNEMLRTKTPDYISHIKSLPTYITDLSPKEYIPGDFMVHFYAYHGKELYEIFKLFEEKYGYIIDELERSLRVK